MTKPIIAKATLFIAAPIAKVWDALIKSQQNIKQLDEEIITDWKVGSQISYTKKSEKYEVKGKVLQVENEKSLIFTFWNSAEGLSDIPENYKTVQFDLCADESGTRLTITFSKQIDIQTETDDLEKNLKLILTHK